MTQAPTPPTGGGEPRVTPQGFLVEEDDGGNWKSVLLARTSLPPNGTCQRLLGFGSPEPAIRAMLEVAELFGVLADRPLLGAQTPDDFGTGDPTFANGLWLGSWPVTVAVGEDAPPDRSNVVLLKYCSGTLRDLIADPKLWSGSDLAGTDKESLSDWMKAYVASACLKAENDPLYRPFAEMVDDEGFAGILVLRPGIDLGALPGEMGAMPSWLGGGPLYAHHCGIVSGDARYPMFFGAIDAAAVPAGEPDGLALASLRALFRYSAVTELELSLTALPTDMTGVAPIVLKSSYRNDQGKRRYAFEPVAESFALDRPEDPARPLGEWLMRIEPLLSGWLGAERAGGTFELRLSCEYPLAPDGPWTALPVLTVPPTPIDSAAEALWAVADRAVAWLAETAPPATGARFSLAASVQSDPSSDGSLQATLPPFTVALEHVAGAGAEEPSV